MPKRFISAVSLVILVGFTSSACGASGNDAVVARVAGVATITKASLEHWMPIEATVVYEERPTGPVPKGVMPDPPDYTACIAFIRSPRSKMSESIKHLSDAQLKGRCKQRYAEVKELTLNTLIGWYWTIAAGKASGFKASEAEVTHRLHETSKDIFASHAEFVTYLKRTRQTVADYTFRSRVQVFEDKLFAKLKTLEKGLPQTKLALAKFIASVPPGKQWAAKTTCSKGYVVSACKEYRGSNPPGIPN